VGGSAGLTLDGGTFDFLGNATQASNETFGGPFSLPGGDSTISSSNGSGGTALQFSSLARSINGGTVSFVAPTGSAAIGGTLNQIRFSNPAIGQLQVNASIGQPTNILPFAAVTSPAGAVDFAASISGSIAALPASAYTQGLAAAAQVAKDQIAAKPGSNGITDLVVKQSTDDTKSVGSSGLGIAALLIDSGGTTSLSLAGPLILTSGGLVTTGSSLVTISGGQLVVSPASGTGPTELILDTSASSSETIQSPIVTAGLPATATVTLSDTNTQVLSIQVTSGGFG
jgi:hypothetical protein